MAIHYENAPITEALIDIRVQLPQSVTLDTLKLIHELVRERYPTQKTRKFVQGRFSMGEQVTASAEQIDMGFSFSSEDGKQVFQARLDGFTFSRLRPYGSWPQLRDEARRLWLLYSKAVAPQKITRIAVRYINQIDIPLAEIDYKDYFRTSPEVSPDLPQGLSAFFMQLQFPQADFEGLLILTQTAIRPPSPGMNSVIVDLDVFKQVTTSITEAEVWELLEKLRDRKNEFFEGCITDNTRKLFGERQEY